MKKISDKWKGINITFNFFGTINNNFGLRKKKIKLEDLSYKLYKSKNLYEIKSVQNKIRINYNEKFEYINIKDYEQSKNVNFLNYLKNTRYFNRINSHKRIMSSNQISNNKFSSNHITKEESEIKRKKVIKKIMHIKLKRDRTKSELNLSKNNLDKIIYKYIQENKKEIRLFNEKNKKINNNLKLNSFYSKNINIFTNKNSDNFINNKLIFENKYNTNKYKNISAKKYFYNKLQTAKKEKYKLNLKKSTLSDASTNTVCFKLKKNNSLIIK